MVRLPPKRRLSQNFLSDPRILERIADALEAGPGDTVLEIGPGHGGLTAVLARRAGRVVAIERDADLVPALRERLPQVEVVEGDALALDWASVVGGGPYLLAGNIPYHITSPLLDRALRPPRPLRIVFLVQKEVAQRLAAPPGTRAYGALSLGIQSVATVERLFAVPAGAFRPKPAVDSAVVRLTPRQSPALPDDQQAAFRSLVVGLFGLRRKQLQRGVRQLTGWPVERVRQVLDRANVDPAARPEQLDVPTAVRLYRELVDAGWRMA